MKNPYINFISFFIFFLAIFLYSPQTHASVFCPRSKMALPGFGYSYFNATSMVGTELSFVGTNHCLWFGAYADFYTDFDQKHKESFGLEIGALMFGLDMGYMHYVNDQEALNGMRIRPFLSMAYLSLYAGGFFSSDFEGFFDGGILFKWPVCKKSNGQGLSFANRCLN